MSAPSTPRRDTAAVPRSIPTTPTTPATPGTPGTPGTSGTPAAAGFGVRDEMEDPRSTASGAATSSASGGAADDSDGEDEVPDYLRLLSTLQSKAKGSASAGIVIPKRGEKDFEPTGFGGQAKLLERSREAMYQAVSGERTVGSRTLVRATWDPNLGRARLHDVQGKIFETVGVIRRHSHPHPTTRNKHITTVTNELLPEEALFLAERGSLQLYQQARDDAGALEVMSLQQAFAALMQPSDHALDEPLTRHAYLIYAHLKRLGYVVQRAKLVDAVRAAPVASKLAKTHALAHAKGVVADPNRPLRLVTILDVLLYVPRRIAQLAGDAARAVARWLHSLWRSTVGRLLAPIALRVAKLAAPPSRSTPAGLGLGLGLNASYDDARRFLAAEPERKVWDSYDAVFSALQLVPSGHDLALPAPQDCEAEGEVGMAPFYYAWRPATVYRKSHPPAPEFRIVIVDARTTPLPTAWQFADIFARIPMPGSDEELITSSTHVDAEGAEGAEGGEGAEDKARRVAYEKQLKAANEAKNRAAYGRYSHGKQKHLREKAAARHAAASQRAENRGRLAALVHSLAGTSLARCIGRLVRLDFGWLWLVARLFRHAPGCWIEPRFGSRAPHRARGGGGRPAAGGNVFPPLKAGRRSVVLAVVDGSITTLLRFGEAEFAHWRLHGSATPSTRTLHHA